MFSIPTEVGHPEDRWRPDFSQDLILEMFVLLCLCLLYPHWIAFLPKHMLFSDQTTKWFDRQIFICFIYNTLNHGTGYALPLHVPMKMGRFLWCTSMSLCSTKLLLVRAARVERSKRNLPLQDYGYLAVNH